MLSLCPNCKTPATSSSPTGNIQCQVCHQQWKVKIAPESLAASYLHVLQQRGLDRVWQGKYGQGQPTYTPVAEKTLGAFPGAIYEKAKTNPHPRNPEVKRWLGKVGNYNKEDRGDTLNSASATRRGHGRDAVKEKIAADCYFALAQLTGNAFIIPKCRLAHLPVINEYTKNNPQAQAIRSQATAQGARSDRQIHIMSKWIEGYHDINKATVLNANGQRQPFLDHLRTETILTNTIIHEHQPIPLCGLPELLAISRLLMDIDVLGDSGANTGYIIHKNPQGKLIAQIVKVDPGYAFSFDSPKNLLYNLQNPPKNSVARRKQQRLDDEKDIQLGANGLTLRWQKFNQEQEIRFLRTLMIGIAAFQDPAVLMYLLNRNGIWNLGAGENLLNPSLIEDYREMLLDNLSEQQTIYGPRWEELKHLVIPPAPPPRPRDFDLPEIDIPHEYLCPITHELMKDPVILLDDNETYDREAIENYLRNTPNSKSPLTGKPLVRKQVIPNKLLKQTIDKFRDKHPELDAPDRITPSTDESVAVSTNKQQDKIEQEKQQRRAPFFQYQEHLKAYLQQRGILNQHQGEQNYDVFISYPWEDQDKRNLVAHRKLQAFLDRLCKDLKIIGLKVFLDIYDMARDMRQVMERSIEQSGIILTVCKPFLKQRVAKEPDGNIALEIDCTLQRARQNPNNLLPLLLQDSWETALPTPMQQQLDPQQTGQDISKTYAAFNQDNLFSDEYQEWFIKELIPRVLNNLSVRPTDNDPWLLTLSTWYQQQKPRQTYARGKKLAIEQILPSEQYQQNFPQDNTKQSEEKQQQAFNFFLQRLKELNRYRQTQQPTTRNQQLSVLFVYPPIPADATGTAPLPEHAEHYQWISQFSEHLQRAGINPDYWTGETDLPANAPNAIITVCNPLLKQTAESGLAAFKASSSSRATPKNPWQQLQEHLTKSNVTFYPLIYQGDYKTAVPDWSKAVATSQWQKNFFSRNTETKSLAFNQIYYYNLMAGISPKGLLRDLFNYPDNDGCYNFLYTNYQQMCGGWGLTDLLAAEARRQTQAGRKTYTKPPLSQRQIPDPIPSAQLQQLLNHVARGEEEEAEALLQKTAQQPENYSALTLGYGTVTDYSERTFEGISALQYALWAKDTFMWRMVIRYMPKGAIRDQITEWADTNSPQTQRWRRQHGDSYDFQPLIDAYKTLDENWEEDPYETPDENWDPWSSSQITDYFIKTIGGLQRQVPAHVAQEYAHHTRSFYPTPDFASQTTLPRKAKINEDKNNEGTSFWYSGRYKGGRIGEKWGAYRGYWDKLNSIYDMFRGIAFSSFSNSFHGDSVDVDYTAVQSMSATRAQQLNELVKTVTKK